MKSPKTFKEMLETTRIFFANDKISYYEKGKLWDFLTSLRGPDDKEELPLKNATTAVIRFEAFGNAIQGFGVASFPDSPEAAKLRNKFQKLALKAKLRNIALKGLPLPLTHFLRHAHAGFRALGIPWDPQPGNRKNDGSRTRKGEKNRSNKSTT